MVVFTFETNAETKVYGTDATAGDSATAFFSSGTIQYERGGLEADVNAYNGLIRINGGATSNVTDLSGFNTALGSSIADGVHTTDTFVTNKDTHDHVGGDGAQIDHDNLANVSTSDHHVATVDTNANTVCAGTTTYMDGDGGCDDISSVYEGTLTNSAGLLAALSDETGTGVVVFGTSPTITTPALSGNTTTTGLIDGRDVATDGAKLDLVEASADVTDTTNVNAAGATMNTDYNANTVLLATSDDTPVAVVINASTFVGRKASGDPVAMSAAEARTVLNVGEGATALTDSASLAAALSDETGTGAVVFGTSPTLTTPVFTGYSRHIDIPPSAATGGPTAPAATTVGTSRGLAFNADAEEAFLHLEIPVDWDGVSNIVLHTHWVATSGDAVADGETVKWDITYHSAAVGEAVDVGTAATATVTHTQSGAGTDKEIYDSDITLPYNTGNQPLTAEDHLNIQLTRDVSGDTYSGDPTVIHWELEYTSNALPTS